MAEVDLKTKLTVFPVIKSIKVNEEKAVELKWTKVPLAEKYDIKRSDNPSTDFVHVEWSKKLEYVDATVEKDITYWYRIHGWKRLEGKKTSTTASFVRPVCISDIPAPTNITATVKDGKINLKWDSAEGNKFYIYRKHQLVSRLFIAGKSDKKQFCDEGTVSGQVYEYTVQTVKKEGDKELHGNFSEKVAAVFLDKTEILSAKSAFGKKAIIDLKVVAGADGYILERSDKKDGTFKEIARSEDIVALNFEDKLDSRFKSYYYRACAYKQFSGKEFKGNYSDIKSVSAK